MRRAGRVKLLVRSVLAGVFMAASLHFLNNDTWASGLIWWIPTCVLVNFWVELHGWTRVKVWIMRRLRPPKAAPSVPAVQQGSTAADDTEPDSGRPQRSA
ncbi:hypothetical protein Raf01_28900 [Rugosimonospora africana]|uniref:Uncharacterized protein n=1 Tax=Rugosimonospora africana TaxID=556532 RepID=A0A8J3QPL3_9ACTN|nr:hypothetical protein Raf01_28900 [Rugosimonospora africana]